MKFFECSAKEGINIDEAFQGLIEEINEHYEHYKKIDSQGKKLTDVDNTNSKKKCCWYCLFIVLMKYILFYISLINFYKLEGNFF